MIEEDHYSTSRPRRKIIRMVGMDKIRDVYLLMRDGSLEISQCPSCLCMTKTVNGYCGKCNFYKDAFKGKDSVAGMMSTKTQGKDPSSCGETPQDAPSKPATDEEKEEARHVLYPKQAVGWGMKLSPLECQKATIERAALRIRSIKQQAVEKAMDDLAEGLARRNYDIDHHQPPWVSFDDEIMVKQGVRQKFIEETKTIIKAARWPKAQKKQ